jgi:hypothetical protein
VSDAGGDGSSSPADVEDLAGSAEDDGYDLRVAGDPADVAGAEGLLVWAKDGEPVAQLGQGHGDGDGGPAVVGVAAVGGSADQVGERVGAAPSGRPRVRALDGGWPGLGAGVDQPGQGHGGGGVDPELALAGAVRSGA